MRIMLLALFAIFLLAGCAISSSSSLDMKKEQINYSVGYQIGQDFQKQNIPLNSKALLQGINDAVEGVKPMIAAEKMQNMLIDLKKEIIAEEKAKKQRLQEDYRSEGREFLERNSKNEGISVLESGLQYQILQKGTGKKPTLKDRIKVHYKGTTMDGIEFDSTYRRGGPEVIPVGSVIPGWQEALPMMRENARWRLFIPSDLAFGEQGPLADQVVIYDIELLEVMPGI